MSEAAMTIEDDAYAGTAREIQPSILEVDGLTTSFFIDGKWQEAVKGISFAIGSRETVALVGESGSGKSVTALSIMRLISANGRISGKVLFNGQNLFALPERRMRHVRGNEIAMIFQEPMSSLNPILAVGDQVAEALLLHRDCTRQQSRTEALRLLDRVKIPAAARRYNEYPHELSGGMRQRVVIAMALACRPKLLIADEPTTALDVTIQSEILGLIQELQRESASSVLFITHDMGVVAEIADRTHVMLEGRLVETGSTIAVFERPQHVYTRRLLAAVPRLGSLQAFQRPVRYPEIDPVTGRAGPAVEVSDATSTSYPPLLEVRNLVTRFRSFGGVLTRAAGRVHAVENVSFVIRAGETLSLVGESGCGKSTIGRSIVGLATPESGNVLIDGIETLNKSERKALQLRKGIQMVFQDPYGSLNPRMTVGAAIAEPLTVHKIVGSSEAKTRAIDLLERVGLSAATAKRYPHELSGGQRQRICIARALALEPKIIIADEAVSALDTSIKVQIINLLLELQENLKLAFLFISHDIAVVERVSHRVAVMYLGEIVEIGPRAAIFGDPRHPYTKRLLSAVPVPDPRIRRKRIFSQATEIETAFRPLDFEPPKRDYIEVGPAHYVHAPYDAVTA